MDQLPRVYTLLRRSPWWLTLGVLYSTTIGILPVGRLLLEGMAYNVALSSQWGDLALIGCVLVGARALKRPGVDLSRLSGRSGMGVLLCVAIVVGVCAQWRSMVDHDGKFGEVMDAYHNLFIVPLYLFLLVTTGQVTWSVGTRTERASTMGLLLVWAALVVYDARTGRLDQRAWLVEHGLASSDVPSEDVSG